MSITPPDDFVDGGINEELLDELMPLFEAIAADVKVKEREACAKVCEDMETHQFQNYIGRDYAAAIRARGAE